MKKPHVSSHTFGITLFLFVLVFAVLEYTNLSLVGANLSHNTDWYLGQDENAKKYNESIFLAERGDFTGAKSVLSPILNEKNLENPGDVFELYGDLVYQMGGASGDILPFYHRALEQGENLRIEKKITMLLSVSIEEEIGTGTSVDSSLQGGSGDTSS